MPIEIVNVPVCWDDEIPGALVRGTPIVKAQAEDHDRNPAGTKGTVIGSIQHPETGQLFYFVEWETMPGLPVAVVAWKIAAQATH